jgi:phage recombination protein Bet
MTTELTKREMAIAPIDFSPEKVELLKRTICRGATNDELELFIHACRRTGLDPFMKQIHAVKRWQDGREVMAIQTGIDGYRLIADRSDRYVPGREPTFAYDDEGRVLSATAHVKKRASDGTWHEISATAHYDEYVGRKKGGEPNKMWAEKPHIMLAKCAEALALRRAFPAELSGVYTSEEMDQAGPPTQQPEPAVEGEIIEAAKRDFDCGGVHRVVNGVCENCGRRMEPEPPPAKPPIDGAPKGMSDDEKFIAILRDTFESRDFKPDEFSAAVAAVCKKKKITTVNKLSGTDRMAFLEAVAAGRFDQYKAAVTA